jgi:hypothetical protein
MNQTLCIETTEGFHTIPILEKLLFLFASPAGGILIPPRRLGGKRNT